MANVKQVQEIAYHRNGIGGEGFHAVRFTADTDEGPDQNMLGIVFPYRRTGKNRDNPRVAVLNLNLLQGKDASVAFGHNSYRGDHFSDELAVIVEDDRKRT